VEVANVPEVGKVVEVGQVAEVVRVMGVVERLVKNSSEIWSEETQNRRNRHQFLR
jgi:hypothetical protein